MKLTEAERKMTDEALARLKKQADAMTAHGQNMQRYDIEVSVPLLHSADVMHECYASLRAALDADVVAAARREGAAEAWDEGWNQGTVDAWKNGGHESKPNPYRVADVPAEGRR